MPIIYEPEGKAREYAALACNLYTGCNHACKYCYAPAIRRMSRENYRNPVPRKNILREFERDCKKYAGSKNAVLFCFMTDPYNRAESQLRITRDALKLCFQYKIPVKILTKSKTVLNDIDIIRQFGPHISVGITLTMDNDIDSLIWEPGAALPMERLQTLQILHSAGVHTWASFEPVIDIKQSLNMIDKTLALDCVDHYKIGKLNNYHGMDADMMWLYFLRAVVGTLREKKSFYVKRDLREKAFLQELTNDEINPDIYDPQPFL